VLGTRERRILDAFVDVLIPAAADGLGPGGRDAGVPEKIERYLQSLPAGARRLFPFALWTIELYPLSLGPGLKTFTGLPRRARTRVLERLESHPLYPLRSAFIAVKVLSFLLWAEHPEVARATEWGASCT
jgi:hypothetical protein